MKNTLRKGGLILLLPLLAFTSAHKYYLSVTNIAYSEKENTLQITSRIFIDDFDKILEERYDVKGNLATENESGIAIDYIKKYLKSKFAIKINGESKPIIFLGREYDDDIMVCYLEVPNINLSTTESIEIQNEVLFDLFDEQQNVVHFKINGKKKSFVLIRENDKGMLKL
ncbi:MAG: hypothetical protein COA50_15605 [Flavobacteriaceae bacterium]|nr:MAG: hypothetical protein COA50_15605 [Flavobacteriaceae bacterium]